MDEVWIVPCGPRPDKPTLVTSPLDRYNMCHLAIHATFSANFPVKVIPTEVYEPKAMTTPTVLSTLQKQYPNIDFKFVMGMFMCLSMCLCMYVCMYH